MGSGGFGRGPSPAKYQYKIDGTSQTQCFLMVFNEKHDWLIVVSITSRASDTSDHLGGQLWSLSPRYLPDASQLPPRRSPGRCLPDASQMLPGCFPDASSCFQIASDASRCLQMPPRCLQVFANASQMPPDASQMPPDASRCPHDASPHMPAA
jgi:hypothetical protein